MAAKDLSSQARTRRDSPTFVQLITKSDTTTYNPPLLGISIGTAGNLAVIMSDDTAAVTIPANALAVGIMHSMSVSQVMSTNTTASEIVGWR